MHAVAEVGAAVVARVGVDGFAPLRGAIIGNAQSVALTRYRREIADHQRDAAVAVAAEPCEHRLLAVVAADPREAGAVAVQPMQRGRGAIQGVEIADEVAHARMIRIVQQMPRQGLVVAPFVPLREFLAHEQQFLARVRPHEAQVRAQVRELLPFVAGHLAQQRAFAVHHFVVRQRQHEVFAERVNQTEGHGVVMPAPVHGILVHIAQRVVHPAHVPFVVEAQAADIGRRGYAGETRGFFSQRNRAGHIAADARVDGLHQRNRFEILASAEGIRHPFACVARVVAIQHRCHRIHAQAVDTELFQPVQRAAGQERAHFGAAEVVDQRAPVAVLAFARIRVFVQCGPVELRKTVRVLRKMRGHPVDQHADAVRVAGFDETHEAFRRAEACGGREHAQRLIAPRPVERMLRHRQQFDVGEAQIRCVGRQLCGQRIPVEKPTFRVEPPRARMHFVDADRRVARVGGGTVRRQRAHRQRRGDLAGGAGPQF